MKITKIGASENRSLYLVDDWGTKYLVVPPSGASALEEGIYLGSGDWLSDGALAAQVLNPRIGDMIARRIALDGTAIYFVAIWDRRAELTHYLVIIERDREVAVTLFKAIKNILKQEV